MRRRWLPAGNRVGNSSVAQATKKSRIVNVEIVSDAICPWCYVGKRRFEAAVAKLPDDVTVDVHWRPFELNPQMPPEGMDRADLPQPQVRLAASTRSSSTPGSRQSARRMGSSSGMT